MLKPLRSRVKGLLVFLLNRVEKAVSSGGETIGALIVI